MPVALAMNADQALNCWQHDFDGGLEPERCSSLSCEMPVEAADAGGEQKRGRQQRWGSQEHLRRLAHGSSTSPQSALPLLSRSTSVQFFSYAVAKRKERVNTTSTCRFFIWPRGPLSQQPH